MTTTVMSSDHPNGSYEGKDGWTQVRRKGRRTPKTRRFTSSLSPDPETLPTPSAPTLSVEEMKQDHERFTGQWQKSPSFMKLREILPSPNRGPKITNAVCFGIGLFDPPDGSWELRRRAHVQLAAFLATVKELQQDGEGTIPCFFQEPLFNNVEKTFIESLGHQVVDSPKGFELVGADSLVFAVHLYRDVYSRVIANHLPAVFIGTPYQIWDDYHDSGDLDWARMRELDEQCEKSSFPEDHGYTTFWSTSIHWRRRDRV